ncbi:hypothetical protein STM14_2171 [Salmonella enterica subsp. enterica serovar Typhimurium str. 14028S]|uniref:Uncharacterized protein n=2 Tax=Salmonella enterica I TaxID=59201 RepID=A0A0F6B296_SALT1|nr:hypothetical protein SPAB_01424 [Salmonella enterica subsp. enterica serovar Paratyphi B str. SPB7]ACY88634.1 hypothetical protein STM14_2171 [Salmonella enterica subsp. enterica serovar Typhimurium str. 14028S]
MRTNRHFIETEFIGARVENGVYRQKIHAGTWILAQ